MQEEKVSFYSDGIELSGRLFQPDEASTGRPGVVFCSGWGGGTYTRAPVIGEALARHGLVTLAFDYRGWGASSGVPNQLHPLEQAADARAALRYLASRREVDASRLALSGMLTGAAAALHAGCHDQSVGALALLYPFGDGHRWLRSLRPHWQWLEFADRLARDAETRARTGQSEEVDPNDILIRDPDALRRDQRRRAELPGRGAWRLGLDSAQAIVDFRPQDHVARLADRPVLLVAVERDTLMPLPEVEELYRALPGPKRLRLIPEAGHHDIYEPRIFQPLLDDIGRFLTDALEARVRSARPGGRAAGDRETST